MWHVLVVRQTHRDNESFKLFCTNKRSENDETKRRKFNKRFTSDDDANATWADRSVAEREYRS